MEKATQRAKEINLAFGKMGKYVILEVIENLKWLGDSLNFDKAMDYWKDVQKEYAKFRPE